MMEKIFDKFSENIDTKFSVVIAIKNFALLGKY